MRQRINCESDSDNDVPPKKKRKSEVVEQKDAAKLPALEENRSLSTLDRGMAHRGAGRRLSSGRGI
jgi:hypothetical protein